MSVKAATERLRLRAAEKISADCSTSQLVVRRDDLGVVLGALDMVDGVMPPDILAKARALKSSVRELQYYSSRLDPSFREQGRVGDDIVRGVERWTERTVDAASHLVDAVLAYEHAGGSGAPSALPATGAAHDEDIPMSNTDSVREGQAEVNARVQRAVDRNVAARSELDASNQELADIENELVTGDAATLNFLRAYRNPTTPNPEPIAPEVAAPPPVEEPPVFTDVSTPTITPDTTSGGVSDVAAALPVEEFPELAPIEDAGAAAPATPGDGDTAEGG